MFFMLACAYEFADESNVCGTVTTPVFAPSAEEAELWLGAGACARDTGATLELVQSVPVDASHFEATVEPGDYGVEIRSGDYLGCTEFSVASSEMCDAEVSVVLEPYVAVKKPNLYLYPTVPMQVAARVSRPHDVVVSDPPHGGEGWRVTAYPNGALRTGSGPRDFLFYELAYDPARFQRDEGWCVPGPQAQHSIESAMRDLGFAGNEVADFAEAWDPIFPASPWMTVYPQLHELPRVDVAPAPDSFLRAWFYVVPGCATVREPELPPFNPVGFVATEWGVAFDPGLGPVVVG